MNKKQIIRLTEGDLKQIVKESVGKILNENAASKTIERFRLTDPMELSDDELRNAIHYMLSYRWALDDETLLKDYIAEKKRRHLTESDLHRIVKESVNKIINEIGDTQRGQWMLGRLKNRQSNGGGKFARGINYNDAGDYAYKANGNSYSDDYQQGYEDEGNNGRNADSTWDGNKYRRMQFNYDAKKMSDMDKLGRKFIDFIEHYQGGVLLQTIVDYETGNQTGKPESPLKELIPIFEEEVLGYDWGTKCTPEMRKAIEAAYNQWWNYAEPMLTDNY